ncbi:ABC transporter permease [Citricoccus muralis]|uniref:ABC transporter permease n=1 Tax=Citricoccus muralis TaxID=169134 RepID=A0ABY8H5D5_9MICC|nr:ABC transporter permease [Citricoccus muralis]WFP16231.1 ABC transporter permease [Citricoccus muralis]
MLRNLSRLLSVRIAAVFLVLILGLALLGPVLAPFDPLARSPETLQHPSWTHWMGTDYMGRDVFSRILSGATISVLGAVEVAVIALVVGAIPGILSVYLGRVFEWVTLRVIDTLIALPFLVVAVAMTALLGNGVHQAMIAVGLLVSPVFYRVARAAALAAVSSQYVEAAVLNGASTWWVVRHHISAKVIPALGVAVANTMGAGLVVIASLTFIGVGVQPPAPTWGGVLASDLGYLTYRPYAPFFPIALIMGTVWALNAIADGIRDVAGDAGRALGKQAHAVPSTAQKIVKPEAVSS